MREGKVKERAPSRVPAEAAVEAVKAYIRLNRNKLAHDSEILALLLPERFATSEVRDLQRHVIDRLTKDNAALRAECDGLRGARDRDMRLAEAVRLAVLELVDARTFDEAIAVARGSARKFGANRAAICVEGEENARPKGATGVRLLAAGTVDTLLGPGTMAGVLSNGASVLFGTAGGDCRSIAAFRLRIGTPAALYVLGAREPRRFVAADTAADLFFFARALERAIRAWLDLPKL
jgi:hypothetical protein